MHMLVYVAVEDGNSLDDVMERWNENREVEPYIWLDKDALLEDAKKFRQSLLDENPSLYGYSDSVEKIRDAKTDEELVENYCDYYGYFLDKDGNALSTFNSEAEWDWYEVGGRWDSGIYTKDTELVNSAKPSEIDLGFKGVLCPHAFVSRDEGWVNEDEVNENWEDYVKERIKELSDNYTIYCVDCHI